MGGGGSKFKPERIRNTYAQSLYREFCDRYDDNLASEPDLAQLPRSTVTSIIFDAFEVQADDSELLVLDLSSCPLDALAITTLLQLVEATAYIEALNLSNQTITLRHASELSTVLLNNATLARLELIGTSLTPEHITSMGAGLAGTALEFLNVSHNALGPEGVGQLCGHIVDSPLHRLLMSDVALDGHVSAVVDAIAYMSQLAVLAVCDNGIDESGGRRIISALKAAHTVTSIDLRDNPIPEDHIIRATALCGRNAFARSVVDGMVDAVIAGSPLAGVDAGPGRLKVKAAFAETVGRRPEMEDVVVMRSGFRDKPDEHFYAVYDGHGGRDAAEFASVTLHHLLADIAPDLLALPESAIRQGIHRSFVECARQMSVRGVSDGTTALCTWIIGDTLISANAGDSRSVLCREGRAVRMSRDHKPIDPDEKARITQLGGFVEDKRVLGTLSVSRALGDFFLEPYVIPDPHITFDTITPKDDFIIMACDGLWDVVSDGAAVSLVMGERDPVQASIKLRDAAFLKGSTDNISVVVIMLG